MLLYLRQECHIASKGDYAMESIMFFILVFVVICTAVIAGCTQQLPVAQTPQPTAIPAPTIMTTASSLGTILVDAQGKTLYYFANDIPATGTSSCYGQCAIVWPIFSTDTITVSPPLVASDFSSITRTDGKKQTTYRGWPLYYYQADAQRGDVKGENVNRVWFVVKPYETVMISNKGTLGSFLTDRTGKTLYFFTMDTSGASTCTGTCQANWPAFSAEPVVAPSVLKPTDFSVLTRSDGAKQVSYMGRPLYYFAADTKPGDIKGEGVNTVWYVANVSGITPVAPAPPATVPTTTRTTSPSGGGYGGGY
jgi:predicted lipoprotein with Yx(FWY)xxD motif